MRARGGSSSRCNSFRQELDRRGVILADVTITMIDNVEHLRRAERLAEGDFR
jgi:hypothetical protein